MQKFMKMLNNISRSQAIYRQRRISAPDLQPSQYAFVLTVCQAPGSSQEEIARELCLNKSTVARSLTALEENGYIKRELLQNDKRQFAVYPSQKMLAALPEVKAASSEWMALLSEDIAPDELSVFNSVLERMQRKAREITKKQDDGK